MRPQKSQNSEIDQAEYYRNFMGSPNLSSIVNRLTDEVLRSHQIKVLSSVHCLDTLKPKLRIKLLSTSKQGVVAQYCVSLYQYRIYVRALNVKTKKKRDTEYFDQGSYGRIEEKSLARTQFVAKILDFGSITPSDIRDIVQEVAIGKLCSALQIGPAIETRIPFDLVIYDNAIQFHMERCQKISDVVSSLHRLKQDLKDNLAVLHHFHIIHKDIKPANVLWSQKFNKFVLCDFGISHHVPENSDEQSRTHYEGTINYMSPEMYQIGQMGDRTGQLNLYYNDAYGLQLTFKQVLKMQAIEEHSQEISREIRRICTGECSSEQVIERRPDRIQRDMESQNHNQKCIDLSESLASKVPVSVLSVTPGQISTVQENQTIKTKATVPSAKRAHVEPYCTEPEQSKLVQSSHLMPPESRTAVVKEETDATQFTDSYEFYRFFYASISPSTHNFHILEDLNYLSQQQFQYAIVALRRSKSSQKMTALMRQIKASHGRLLETIDSELRDEFDTAFERIWREQPGFDLLDVNDLFQGSLNYSKEKIRFLRHFLELARVYRQTQASNIQDYTSVLPKIGPCDEFVLNNFIRIIGKQDFLMKALEAMRLGKPIYLEQLHQLYVWNFKQQTNLHKNAQPLSQGELKGWNHWGEAAVLAVEDICRNKWISSELKEYFLLDLCIIKNNPSLRNNGYLRLLFVPVKNRAQHVKNFISKSNDMGRCMIVFLTELNTLGQLSETVVECCKIMLERIIVQQQAVHFSRELLLITLTYLLSTGDISHFERLLPNDQSYPDNDPDLTNQLLVVLSSDVWELPGDNIASRISILKLRAHEHSEYYDLLQANELGLMYELFSILRKLEQDLKGESSSHAKLFVEVGTLCFKFNNVWPGTLETFLNDERFPNLLKKLNGKRGAMVASLMNSLMNSLIDTVSLVRPSFSFFAHAN